MHLAILLAFFEFSRTALSMCGAGILLLLIALLAAKSDIARVSGLDKIVALSNLCFAMPLAVFGAEHFSAAKGIMQIVPKFMPWPLFWTYFVGIALLAAAISFIAWRYVRWSALLLALLFLIFVATIHVPNLLVHAHERLFWTLTTRETAFAGGAMVLAGSLWVRWGAGIPLIVLGRLFVEWTFLFYAVEHFLFPLFVPGVPLEKMTPAWVPAPALLAYVVGATLFAAGVGLMFRRTRRVAAATAGSVLLLLTFFFYIPILITEIHSPLAVEGVNYVGDTLLFAATALLAGFGADQPE